jgi:DNA (cytosine-5)-methyltransferase 1
MNAKNAALGSTHKFSYKWSLNDLEKVEKNGCTVFSFFSCGGGSSMGYKLAGFDVIGNCEIDEKVNKVYVKNNHPKHNYRMDIRDFLQIPDEEIPEELKNLDILDGSPPCSTFSMAGSREDSWGKEKKFREGQAAQTLDDLFFYYIRAIEKLQPKIFVAENVEGILLGNAKGYVNQIIKELDAIGYTCQIFLFNAASMGVPQKRKRTFFIGHKKGIDLDDLKMAFNERPIKYGEFAEEDCILLNTDTKTYERWQMRRKSDSDLGKVALRVEGRISGYTTAFAKLDRVCMTQVAGGRFLRFDKPGFVSDRDVTLIQSFPIDYDFNGVDPCYICGMSVPPVMTAQIASEIYKQWLEGMKDGK